MDEELKTNINYILTTYPEYIDTLQIVELKNQLLNDYHIDPWTISRAIGGILQLIVNECGSDIVNDINIDEARVTRDYYNGIKFNQHVTIKKDNIQPYEFRYAEFTDGITIQSKKLPRGALTGAKVYGTIDLTSVEILEPDNLVYSFAKNCTVKLSKNLKEIESGSFVVNIPNKPRIEYDGLVSEFNELVENNISRWASNTRKNSFIYLVDILDIKCNDGI